MTAPLVVLVTGGRDCDRADLVAAVLDRALHKADAAERWFAIVHGACGVDADDKDADLVEQARGADGHAHRWAVQRRSEGWRVGWWAHPARWKALGKKAGPERNFWMLVHFNQIRLADKLCLAFPQGSPKWPDEGGTADCVRQARRIPGLRVGVVGDDGVVGWDPPSVRP